MNISVKRAIVSKPTYRMIHGISTANLGPPNYLKALEQHANYIKALEECGASVTILDADHQYPDSTFVEDTAVLTDNCAIIANLHPESRKGEEIRIQEVLEQFYDNIEQIKAPGTLEGGDVIRAKDHFYIGRSSRTNQEGASQLLDMLNQYGYSSSIVKVENFLHLKSGIEYIGKNTLIGTKELLRKPQFKNFTKIEIKEKYCTDFLRVNNTILTIEGCSQAQEITKNTGFNTLAVDISEFKKLNAGLSCLSLLF